MTDVLSLVPEGRHGLLTHLGSDGHPGSGGDESLAQYLAVGGYAPVPAPDRLLGRIDEAGLRGRGGAGFPAAVKLRSVRDAPGPPVVVANGEEGEPGSVKDRWLLRHRPHLVLDGLRLAAAVTGAGRACVYLSDAPAEYAVRQALAEQPQDLPVDVVRTTPSYVAGEETAVVRRIDGGPALPTAKPPRPFERGVGGAPTLVANVETLARIAVLHSWPGAAHTVVGAHLVTLAGPGGRAALVEAPAGTGLGALAESCGHGAAGAVLLGGMFGGLYGAGWAALPLDQDRLAAAGGALGCGAMYFPHPDECPVSVAAEATAYLAAQSARQCGVCVSGTGALAGALTALALGKAEADTSDRLERWSQQLVGRGACGLLDAAARIAGSLLTHFPGLVAGHRGTDCPGCGDAATGDGRRLTVAVP
ncbi:NADH-ubiquinone oxidoreductase-F iron-sulfur binding region domain-containing protein [Streptomyces sp. NPDC086787]|uniref:NADH-ubiquinone oxidoreductase-F iron-sulfur binding region domain-containing protein n=1 Tax=Streptomyces sp. NPDC086787 TaxID=3365759 RepID=UPI00382741DA